ncbi:hypothetical protein LTS18_007157 [Coniosporium uncinatum]|uniref:Uncharacterized protein n=1 Tax=Coniosporium uncinatum TaxID=93489 RepID=A0ACC3D3C3_9PEZI|nr:hypothetical protein LTS18_007157 [Coniosporium uncinatum]
MSQFGGPGARAPISKPTPYVDPHIKPSPSHKPERGSFPLDHDGECTALMKSYLTCLKLSRGENTDACRLKSKAYLQCRMQHNLMAPDEMRNLGYGDEEETGGDGGRMATGGGVTSADGMGQGQKGRVGQTTLGAFVSAGREGDGRRREG